MSGDDEVQAEYSDEQIQLFMQMQADSGAHALLKQAREKKGQELRKQAAALILPHTEKIALIERDLAHALEAIGLSTDAALPPKKERKKRQSKEEKDVEAAPVMACILSALNISDGISATAIRKTITPGPTKAAFDYALTNLKFTKTIRQEGGRGPSVKYWLA